MKTFKNFILEAPTESQAAQMAPDMAPEKRRAALEKNARNQAKRTTPPNKFKPKASLPPGKTGGDIEKRASAITKRPSSAITKPEQKSSAIVKSNNYKEPRASRPDEKRDVGVSTTSPRVRIPEKPKPKAKENPRDPFDWKKWAKRALEAGKKAGQMATKDYGRDVETSNPGNLGGPERRTSSRM